jgi:hypothetical protein
VCGVRSRNDLEDLTVSKHFKCAFGMFVSLHPGGDAVLMLKMKGAAGRSVLHDFPGRARVVLYSVLKESIVGGGVGGAQLKYDKREEPGVTGASLYCHGPHCNIRNRYGNDFSTPRCIVSTILETFAKVHQVVINLWNSLFLGAEVDQMANRVAFGTFRFEFSVNCWSVRQGRQILDKYLQECECEEMMVLDEKLRRAACVRFTDKHALEVIKVRLELVMQSLTESTIEFQQMLLHLKTESSTVEGRMTDLLDDTQKTVFVRLLKEMCDRRQSTIGWTQECWGDVPPAFWEEILPRVCLVRMKCENHEGQTVDGFILVRKNTRRIESKIVGHYKPLLAVMQGVYHALHALTKEPEFGARSNVMSVFSYGTYGRKEGFYSMYHDCESAKQKKIQMVDNIENVQQEMLKTVRDSGNVSGKFNVNLKGVVTMKIPKKKEVGKQRHANKIAGAAGELAALTEFLTNLGCKKGTFDSLNGNSKESFTMDETAVMISTYKEHLKHLLKESRRRDKGKKWSFCGSRWWEDEGMMRACRLQVRY